MVMLLWISALMLAPPAQAQVVWPADTDWIPATLGVDVVTDPANDVGGTDVFDIVGDLASPAVLEFGDPTHMFLRVRLADTPQKSPTKWENFAFFDYHEQDGDTTSGTWDVVLYLDGNAEQVIIGDNTSVGGPDWCRDQIDTQAFTYPAPPDFSGNARVVPAGTALGSLGADQFLDIAVERADYYALTGRTDLVGIQHVYATSATVNLVNKDVAYAECDWGWQNAVDGDPPGDTADTAVTDTADTADTAIIDTGVLDTGDTGLAGDTDTDTDADTDTDTDADTDTDDGGEDGNCGCSSPAGAPALLPLLGGLFLLRRRN
jgi:MYXO-CTERM domain-containing protein